MKADEIWEMGHLQEEVKTAKFHLKKSGKGWYVDLKGAPAYMLGVLSCTGYHQAEEIAGGFGLDYAVENMNEDEMEEIERKIQNLKTEILKDLGDRINLPAGLSFGLDYDRQGNFGLVLRIGNGKDPGKDQRDPSGYCWGRFHDFPHRSI